MTIFYIIIAILAYIFFGFMVTLVIALIGVVDDCTSYDDCSFSTQFFVNLKAVLKADGADLAAIAMAGSLWPITYAFAIVAIVVLLTVRPLARKIVDLCDRYIDEKNE